MCALSVGYVMFENCIMFENLILCGTGLYWTDWPSL